MNELLVHSGRLCCRVVSGGNDVVMGLLHLDPAVSIQEGAEYLLLLENNRVRLVALGKRYSDFPNGGLTMEQMSQGLCGLVLHPIWHGTTLKQARTVRLVKQFDDSNGWLVVGPKQDSAFTTDQWWDVVNNHLSVLPSPGEFVGHALKGLLHEPLWPHPNGQMHSLTDVFQIFRPIYHNYHTLLATAARSPVYKDLHRDIVSVTPNMPLIASTLDPEYANFLSVLDAEGKLTPPAPQTAAQRESEKQVAHRAVRHVDMPAIAPLSASAQATIDVLEALKSLQQTPHSLEFKTQAFDTDRWQHISDWLHVAPLAIKTQTMELVEHIADVFLTAHPDHMPPQLSLLFTAAVRWNAPQSAVALHQKMRQREQTQPIPKNSDTRLKEMLSANMVDEVFSLHDQWENSTHALVADRLFYSPAIAWSKKAHLLQSVDTDCVKEALRTRYVVSPQPTSDEFDAFCTTLGLAPAFNLVHERSPLRSTIEQVKQLRADRRQKQKLEKAVARHGVAGTRKKM